MGTMSLIIFHIILVLYPLNTFGIDNEFNATAITTWAFTNAGERACEVLKKGGVALDAVQAGCTSCEEEQCEHTVGFGGSPDENGETTLDAMLMEGNTLNVGAVAGLRRIKPAVAVARKVLDLTDHSLLVGDLATNFAKSMGFTEEPLYSNFSQDLYKSWTDAKCQPNFWVNVNPDPKTSCGPYSPPSQTTPFSKNTKRNQFGPENHDTVGMVALDSKGNIAAGTSSNGAKHKIPGRVGDSPIPGAGCYADSDVGGAAATGDGDVMMRFLPSFVAVEQLRLGAHPNKAANTAIKRITAKYPSFSGGIVVLRKDGKYGAACHGMPKFPYVVTSAQGTQQMSVTCK